MTSDEIVMGLYERVLDCPSCNGTGLAWRCPDSTCPHCGGQGLVCDATSMLSEIRERAEEMLRKKGEQS